MLKTEREYKASCDQLALLESQLENQRRILEETGLTDEQVEEAMMPMLSFCASIREDIEFYERVKKKDFTALSDFESIGRLLIALRIASNMTQHELAVRLQVSDSQISRDERDEYHGATLQKIRSVLHALGYRLQHKVEPLEYSREAS